MKDKETDVMNKKKKKTQRYRYDTSSPTSSACVTDFRYTVTILHRIGYESAPTAQRPDFQDRDGEVLSLPIADRGKDILYRYRPLSGSQDTSRETTESPSHVRRLESSVLATMLGKGREFSRAREAQHSDSRRGT